MIRHSKIANFRVKQGEGGRERGKEGERKREGEGDREIKY
jgi:hypothetical protein